MAFVLDASATLPWCFHDEATPETDRLLNLATSTNGIYVPGHWPMEVLNGLHRAARRQRTSDQAVDAFLDDLSVLDISVDMRPLAEQWAEAIPLARLYELSAYDAAYLALAIRLSIPLATFDERLRVAAAVEKVSLII